MQWEDFICPECGAPYVVRLEQEGSVSFPESPEAPVFCSLCGWNGEAKDLAIEPEWLEGSPF